jgi:hypothetical protein
VATERKSPGYERALEKINYFILRWHEIMENEPIPVDLCKHCGGRILEFLYTRKDGRQAIRRQCFVVDPMRSIYYRIHLGQKILDTD